MSDNVLQWSVIGLTIVVIGWLVGGIVRDIIPIAAVVIIGIVAEIVLGGTLLYFWSRSSMKK